MEEAPGPGIPRNHEGSQGIPRVFRGGRLALCAPAPAGARCPGCCVLPLGAPAMAAPPKYILPAPAIPHPTTLPACLSPQAGRAGPTPLRSSRRRCAPSSDTRCVGGRRGCTLVPGENMTEGGGRGATLHAVHAEHALHALHAAVLVAPSTPGEEEAGAPDLRDNALVLTWYCTLALHLGTELVLHIGTDLVLTWY